MSIQYQLQILIIVVFICHQTDHIWRSFHGDSCLLFGRHLAVNITPSFVHLSLELHNYQ